MYPVRPQIKMDLARHISKGILTLTLTRGREVEHGWHASRLGLSPN